MKDKLISFARTDEEINLLLSWIKGTELQHHEISTGQKWSIVNKAFSISSLSQQEKEDIFALQK